MESVILDKYFILFFMIWILCGEKYMYGKPRAPRKKVGGAAKLQSI